MARDEEGVWSVTIPPAVPGFHYYWFLVDGVAVNDPASHTFFGYGQETSAVEVDESGADFYQPQHVPRGEVRMRWYFSEVTGDWRRAYVYTPPGYDADPLQSYPVLYLQHGGGEDDRGWTTQGRANFILDNLIAAGEARPMIMVNECGYATRQGAAPPPAAGELPRDAEAWRQRFEAFEAVVIDDLIPMVDGTYRTIPDRAHRAIAGLSMGSMQAAQIGMGHLDTFAHIGLFSGPPIGEFDVTTAYGGAFADAEAFNGRVRLFWIGAGTAERMIHERTLVVHEALERIGIRHQLYISPGTAHEWQTWRRSLYDFAPRLFQG
jgi:enterochelin esterase family protein